MIGTGFNLFFKRTGKNIHWVAPILLFLPYFVGLHLWAVNSATTRLMDSTVLIQKHLGSQGLTIGIGGMISLFTSVIESDRKYCVVHITVRQSGKLIMDRAFDPGYGFGLSKYFGLRESFRFEIIGQNVESTFSLSDSVILFNLLASIIAIAITGMLLWGYQLLQKRKLEKLILEAQMDLAKAVCHDLRSPLSALNLITGQSSILPEQYKTLIKSSVMCCPGSIVTVGGII